MIITHPNELLRQKSAPITSEEIESGEIKKLISKMRKELKQANGIGLAAVQISVLKQVILVEMDNIVRVFLNPKIIRKSWKKIAIEEGCLSVPGVNGYVKRAAWIKISALDENGKKTELRAEELTSIIFQHEIDHINGVLFIDKIWKKEK